MDTMSPEEAMKECPHLLSPAHLAIADSQGKWKPAPHLKRINDALVKAWLTPNSRTAITVPFQHGKSLLCSIYFPAWLLLLWPETRIALGSYETGFAGNFGARVRDIVNRYGPGLDVELRTDTKAKSEWAIHKYGGGMICKGRGGPLTGRPADIVILDDVIKNATEAQSQIILDNLWEWYQTVVYSRLGPRAPVILIGTRWCSLDLHGRLMQEEKVGGDKFEWIHFHAIAKENDLLGRKPGAALWPERVPLKRLERVKQTRPRWFQACWQGEPMEMEGLHYQPREWRKYIDVGDAWRIRNGLVWNNYRKVDCQIIIALDWAQKGKKDSDRTAFVVAALTPDGLTLVLDVFDDRLRQEQNAPALAKYCEKWRPPSDGNPIIVASDDDMLSESMALECRRYRGIPEIRRMPIRAQSKLVRAQAGIIRSQNGLFLVPEQQELWFERMADQLSGFTGEEGAEDDIADCFGILGRLADEFNPGEDADPYESVLGAAGYSSEMYGTGGYDNGNW